ncbi:hypothetical protein WA1_21230 [Scytonema hofmannii PCC 7110]|uniref:DUF3110 domain-containing protein n=1 Tax=Scytonema hofmannii PCC 7110 TaxID=128403 RepID=A0A139XCR7_9CYAN|nr:DUF3110 domain-containing protein [Scytonema hofmannii]KYC42487.1 hypothetical protein WA1_21230 [Scytonema hofmannii PCC 7110]
MPVFVLLFNARTENEGIHTIQVGGRNKVLMFESEDDATRFALMLEAQDFLTPTVEEIDSEEVEEFCASANYDWEIIPSDSNSLIVPPEVNVDETDWNPESKQDASEGTLDRTQDSEDNSELPQSELDSIRRKLEGLL